MRIAIVGVGGIGGYFGGKLARKFANSGQHEIIFICRGEHFAAIKKNGLQLFTKEGDYSVRPDLVTDNPARAGVFDLVLFCTKSYHLEKAAQDIAGNINRNTIVIPLLNGVDIADRLSKVLPESDIINGSVLISSSIANPGVVRQTDGACKLTFGTDNESAQRYQHVLDVLLKAGIDAILTDRISQILWTKYLLICPLASLTAATGKTFGGIMEDAILKRTLREMIEEVKAIAVARRIDLPHDIVDKTIELVNRFAYDTKTSMQLDRERGNRTEIDIFTVYIRQSGMDLGIPTPAHDRIYNQILNL